MSALTVIAESAQKENIYTPHTKGGELLLSFVLPAEVEEEDVEA